MIAKEPRCLRIGVLGCGPIAQAAHLDAVLKARNAELYAICDLADDLRDGAILRSTFLALTGLAMGLTVPA